MTTPADQSEPQQTTRCPKCASPASGRFCTNCGAALGVASTDIECARCHHRSPSGTRFCPSCGSPLGAVGPRPRSAAATWVPWILGGGMVVVLLLLLFRSSGRPPASDAQPIGAAGPVDGASPDPGGVPPDISNMSPRERFNRLYQRVITAAQQGDQATVQRFTPMALAAYGMLDKVDADARYHLAMIELHVGDLAAAQAQADSLQKLEPDHLFGYVIGAAVARFDKKDAERDAMYQKFLARYDKEIASKKPEYLEHQKMLEEVHGIATGEKPAK